MNRLSRSERAQIIRALVEGNSIRSTSRMTGFAQNTIIKLLRDLGDVCAALQDQILRNLPSTRIECDEIWTFVNAKARNVPEKHKGEFGWGDVWTWVAIDQDTRLIVSWLVGSRDEFAAMEFIADLGSRLASERVQITTDGHGPYIAAIEAEFGRNVDYAMLIKSYGKDDARETAQARKYSPSKVTGQEVRVISGDPDPERISTSYVERHNLTMRMSMRRFTRLTNAFSRKVENHAAAVSLNMMWQNFGRVQKSLADPYPRTPAMAAGVTDHVWT